MPRADLHDPARVVTSGHLAPEFLRDPGHELDLLDRAHALALLRCPDGVLDADADVYAAGDRGGAQREHRTLPGLHEHGGPDGRVGARRKTCAQQRHGHCISARDRMKVCLSRMAFS